VTAERGGVTRPKRATFFGAQNTGDRATTLSANQLLVPLRKQLTQHQPDWEITPTRSAKPQPRPALRSCSQAAVTSPHCCSPPPTAWVSPAVIHTSWKGKARCCAKTGLDRTRAEGALNEEYYFCADDVAADAQLNGLISCHFACFGAGTPQWDDYAHGSIGRRLQLAPEAFLAALPQRLLSHPKGGALAVIGHVDRAWGYSFVWPEAGRQTDVYEGCLLRLLEGQPIGYAFEYFNQRYAELASDLSAALEDVKFGKRPDHLALAGMWTAHNDARGFAILGDPAVRVAAGPAITQAQQARATVTARDGQAAAQPAPPAPAPVAEQPAAPMQSDAATDFGLRDELREARERLVEAFQTLTTTLSDALQRAVEAASVLEVATYVSDDLAAATYDRATKQFSGAKLRAVSRIAIDGDSVLLVPQTLDEADATLGTLHAGMVEQAQAARAELLKVAVSAVAGLLDAVKVL
jgi:hypothetical protein